MSGDGIHPSSQGQAVIAAEFRNAITTPPADTSPPDTTITAGPSGPVADSTPTFGFASSEASNFQCSVDASAFVACTSPHTTAPLAAGAHSFRVRATDTAGNSDASPARRDFKVDVRPPRFKLGGKRTRKAGRTIMVLVRATSENLRVTASARSGSGDGRRPTS